MYTVTPRGELAKAIRSLGFVFYVVPSSCGPLHVQSDPAETTTRLVNNYYDNILYTFAEIRNRSDQVYEYIVNEYLYFTRH